MQDIMSIKSNGPETKSVHAAERSHLQIYLVMCIIIVWHSMLAGRRTWARARVEIGYQIIYYQSCINSTVCCTSPKKIRRPKEKKLKIFIFPIIIPLTCSGWFICSVEWHLSIHWCICKCPTDRLSELLTRGERKGPGNSLNLMSKSFFISSIGPPVYSVHKRSKTPSRYIKEATSDQVAVSRVKCKYEFFLPKNVIEILSASNRK